MAKAEGASRCWQAARRTEPRRNRMLPSSTPTVEGSLVPLLRDMHGVIVRVLLESRLLIRGGFMLFGLLVQRLQQQTPELAPRGDLHRVLRGGRTTGRAAPSFGPFHLASAARSRPS